MNAFSTERSPVTVKMLLQAMASQMPSWFLSYFDSFISALALARLPVAVAVRRVALELVVEDRVGRDVRRDRAGRRRRPRPCAGPSRSITKLTARRTCRSSNGGCVRFIVRYQVRSPSFVWSCGDVLVLAEDGRRLAGDLFLDVAAT